MAGARGDRIAAAAEAETRIELRRTEVPDIARTSIGISAGSANELVVNQGAFDIAVEPGLTAKVKAAMTGQRVPRPSMSASGDDMARLLVEHGGPPVADTATFKGGVIVLTSSANATQADPHPAPPHPHPVPPHPDPPPHPHPDPPPHHPHPDPPPPHPHPDPPPPHPHPDHPLPPAEQPPPKVPRDEVVVFVDQGDDNDHDRDNQQLIDVSQLLGTVTDDIVDAGVTSGSDPSAWDPINVERGP